MTKSMDGRRLVEQISTCLGLHEMPVANTNVHLTPREREVLSHLRHGAGNKEIALHMSIQVITVKLHVRNLCRKLALKNRTQLALYANHVLANRPDTPNDAV
jgi:DNA-binding NarL/FixJ family response regulator